MNPQALHLEALDRVKSFTASTVQLMDILQRIDSSKSYLRLNYGSMWDYVTRGLKLSESQAQQFISVSRKSESIPELKTAIATGKVSLPKAALIASEITVSNQSEWLAKASELKTRELKSEIAKARPGALPLERVTFRTEATVELKLGLTQETLAKLKRVQDLLCQKNQRPLDLAETIAQLADGFLEKNDPEIKAKKLLRPDKVKTGNLPQGRAALPAWVKHTVHLKHQSQCARLMPDGKRCEQRRFLQIHHKKPLQFGGSNHPDNLILLCSGHHRGGHLK